MQSRDYLLSAIRASVEAGRAILEIYNSDFSVQMKGDQTPLTMADKRSHAIIVRHLEKTGVPILSEEGKDIPYQERKSWNLLWMVDPLDGTKEFIQRNGEFTVNIALIEARKPAVGVIFVPAQNTLYFASRGLGSFKLEVPGGSRDLDSMPVEDILARSVRLPLIFSPPVSAVTRKRYEPSKRDEPDKRENAFSRPLVVIGSRSHGTTELKAFVEDLRTEYREVELLSAGSSLKFCLVAEGTADLYPRLGPTMEWDTAAGQAIAENAGRSVLIWQETQSLAYNREDLLNPWFVVS